MRARVRVAAVLALAGLALLAGCQNFNFMNLRRGGRLPPSNPPQVIAATGTYRHPASGMEFPPEVGEFKRALLLQYDKAGQNISARYEIDGAATKLAAEIYVYPAKAGSASQRAELCRSQLEAAASDLARGHRDAHRTELDDITLEQGSVAHRGLHARYEFDERVGSDILPWAAEINLFCIASDQWQIEYRFIHPRELTVAPIAADFMQRLVWTLPPSP
jgi:hypothetical protein